jgi:hypothetical protein
MSNLMALLPSRRRIIRREALWQWLLNREANHAASSEHAV